jgi:predicted nucleotidyltransferase
MSKILYKALGTTSLKEVVNDVKAVAGELQVDFFGVGALARNVWYIEHDENPRGTKDVDFAVYVSNSETYQELKNILISKFDYTEVSSNPFCLMSPYGIPLDLLPFGEIVNNGKVTIEGKGLVEINLDGFFETYSYGLVETIIEDDRFKICSIPSVVLLKLIAYDDRPAYRLKDATDIASILVYYPDIENIFIWDEYSFLYEDDLEHEDVGIKVLGYELAKIIKSNQELTERVFTILDKAILLKSNLAVNMIINTEIETVDMKIKNLKMLKQGIKEGLGKNLPVD